MPTVEELIVKIKADVASLQAGLVKAREMLSDFTDKVEKLSKSMRSMALKMMAVGGAVSAGFGLAIKEGMELEQQMAYVAKTTGLAGEQLIELRDSLLALSTQMPTSVEELAQIAQIAGQLGIQGRAAILEFTKTVAQMSVAFDMTAEDATINMAKIAGAFALPIKQVKNLASAINVLGNTTAAAEREILNALRRFAGVASQFNITADSASALVATLIALGEEPERAGYRLSSAILDLTDNLDKLALQMRTTVEELKKRLDMGDALGVLLDYLNYLRRIPSETERAALAQEVFSADAYRAVAKLITAYDTLQVNLKNAQQGFIEGTALAKEYENATATLAAQFQRLKNAMKLIMIKVFDKIKPDLDNFVTSIERALPQIYAFAIVFAKTLIPTLKQFGQALLSLMKWFMNLSPAQREALIKFTAIGTAVTMLLGPLLLLASFTLPLLAKSFKMVAGAALFSTRALLAFRSGAISARMVSIATAISLARLRAALFAVSRVAGVIGLITGALWAINKGVEKFTGKALTTRIMERIEGTWFGKAISSLKEKLGLQKQITDEKKEELEIEREMKEFEDIMKKIKEEQLKIETAIKNIKQETLEYTFEQSKQEKINLDLLTKAVEIYNKLIALKVKGKELTVREQAELAWASDIISEAKKLYEDLVAKQMQGEQLTSSQVTTLSQLQAILSGVVSEAELLSNAFGKAGFKIDEIREKARQLAEEAHRYLQEIGAEEKPAPPKPYIPHKLEDTVQEFVRRFREELGIDKARELAVKFYEEFWHVTVSEEKKRELGIKVKAKVDKTELEEFLNQKVEKVIDIVPNMENLKIQDLTANLKINTDTTVLQTVNDMLTNIQTKINNLNAIVLSPLITQFSSLAGAINNVYNKLEAVEAKLNSLQGKRIDVYIDLHNDLARRGVF